MLPIANVEQPLILHLKDSGDGYPTSLSPPSEINYYDRFVRLDRYMNEEVHPRVTAGAAANDPGVWLTDHGPRHISTVIARIGELTRNADRWMVSPYEGYLLAVAAHFHDVGNVFGRDRHERMARTILFSLDDELAGKDTAEKRLICDIAKAHGGASDSEGGLDTIGNLPSQPEGIKKLAAILRFADEVADDCSRTTAIDGMVIGTNEELRVNSEIFHVYADRLRRVEIDHQSRAIRLRFEVLVEHLKQQYGRMGVDGFFLDEIFNRTLKMHREQVYCGRFMLPAILSERIEVSIQICTGNYKRVLGSVPYILQQKGYPGAVDTIESLAPQLAGLSGRTAASAAEGLVARELDEYQEPPNLIEELKQEA